MSNANEAVRETTPPEEGHKQQHGGPGTREPSWLMRQRVLLPERVAGYVDRPPLEHRCASMDHPVTMLVAPGGFGKTALLVQSCRHLRDTNTVAAWLSVEEEDRPNTLAMYLALAFEEAGMTVLDPADDESGRGHLAPERESRSHAMYRLNLLLDAIERHGSPTLLALDELERLTEPESIRLLNTLIRSAPRNLHVAMAMRQQPPGLEAAMLVLEGSATTITLGDLRFSRSEISRFFGGRLSRRELDDVAERSAGWPMALRIYGNAANDGTFADVDDNTVAGWIETRLWRGLSSSERDLMLDVALFDWFDGELLDHVVGRHDSAQRIASMRALTGVLLSTGGDRPKMRLHPLIRDYCAAQRLREDPARSREIHDRAARALAHRSQVVDALRHAVLADDIELVGSIAEQAGGLRVVASHGSGTLFTIVYMLNTDVIAAYPRLGLGLCAVLAVEGDMARATQVYREIGAATGDFTRDRVGGDDNALALDHFIMQGVLAGTGCRLPGMKAFPTQRVVETASARDLDAAVRGLFAYGLGVVHSQRADFDGAVEWVERARLQFGPRSHLMPHVLYELGSVAFAQGRADEASGYYEQGLTLAKGHYLRDTVAVAIGRILKGELAFERLGATAYVQVPSGSLRMLAGPGATFQVYVTAISLAVEQALWHGAVNRALVLVEDARAYATATHRPGLTKHVAALQVSALLAAQRLDDAERVWRTNELPETAEDCLDLHRRGWRRLETISCVRARLHIARGELDEARCLMRGLRDLAGSRNLGRTLMRAEVLSMVVEQDAGNIEGAMRHLESVVRLYAESGYGGPLASEKGRGLALLGRLWETSASEATDNLFEFVSCAVGNENDMGQSLTEPELDVLRRLAARQRDKQIARELGLTVDGVRYRIRRIFLKLDARNRLDAVDRAGRRGLLSTDEAERNED